jgi:glyoxylase-like metal-dependent hydrolase (beta-lactamase superfamily II)
MQPNATIPITRFEGKVMAVNSYIVEGPDGIVIIDGQLTVSDARALRSMVDQIDRPVAGLVITHPHPDHYAGAATVLDGLRAPVIATAEVAAVIERDDAAKDGIVGPMMGPEWPTDRRFPDEIVSAGESFSLAGLNIDVRAVGAAESHADTLFSLDERTVFSGDIAYNDMHAYLVDGHHQEWLALLDRLERELGPDVRLYVGHGEPAGTSVLTRQADHIRTFVDTVAGLRDAPVGERHDRVVAVMGRLVRDDRLLFLMELSIEPVLEGLP